jgi:hypothetical protein
VYASDGAGLLESIGLNQRTLGPYTSPCRGDKTPYPDLGILDYSTAKSSGSLTFKVNIYDGNKNIIVQGSTDPVAVNPGHVLATIPLVASPCLDPNNPHPDISKANQPNEGNCNF